MLVLGSGGSGLSVERANALVALGPKSLGSRVGCGSALLSLLSGIKVVGDDLTERPFAAVEVSGRLATAVSTLRLAVVCAALASP